MAPPAPSPPPSVRAAFDAGRAAHPTVGLAIGLFAAAIVRREAAGASLSLGATPVDSFLSIACDEGASGAWEAFSAEYGPRLRALCVSRGVPEGEAEARVSDLIADLALPPPRANARTLLGTFHGRGSLFSWLAVILARRGAAAAARRPAPLDADRAEEVAASARRTPDPLAAAADAETAGQFSTRFAAAWSSLSDRERLALLLRYRDGVAQIDIARLLRVGPPRASRILSRAVERIRAWVCAGTRHEPPDAGARLWAAMRDAVRDRMATIAPAAAHPATAARPEDRRAP
jgi:RNA polymerase sigma factor (sigma-70 family)